MKTQCVSWLLAGLLLSAGGATAQAQMKIAYGENQEPKNFQTISLRPNQEQSVYFSYQNPTKLLKRNLKITLEQVDEAGKAKLVSQVEFDKTKTLKPDEKTAFKFPAPAGKGDWMKLDGPPFQFRFTVEDGKGGAEGKDVADLVDLTFEEPRDYITIVKSNYDPAKQRLSITLRLNDPLGAPSKVKLELPPSVNLGLIESKAGTREGVLDAKNPQLELVADEIQFEGKTPPANGRVYLTVDGFERAFIYKCTYSEGSLLPVEDKTRARMVLPRYVQPGPKVAVTLEVDGQSRVQGLDDSPQRAKVELTFDRVGSGNFGPVPGSPFRGLRHQEIHYKIDTAGGILFKTEVKDRVVELNTLGINGKRALRIRLTDAKGTVLDLADEQENVNEKVALFDNDPKNKSSVLTYVKSEKSIAAEVILDATKPRDLAIDAPATIAPGDDLTPKLSLKPRQPDEAPIGKVVFFLGELDDGDKIPAAAKKSIVEGKADATGVWTPKEAFKIPADAKDKIYVSAVATTMTDVFVGTTKSIPIKVPVVAGKDDKNDKNVKTAKKKAPATIKGTVFIGEVPQPGLKVVLKKAKATKDDKDEDVDTDATGNYEFKDVEPGDYVIETSRMGRIGRMPVRVTGLVATIETKPLSLKIK